ncbi:hypothetical protein [Enterovirga sp.]|uniref:hypothetical protein n=1 Tax=Enterovirga sp. TaxID=2026350 RepID=UPI00260F7CB8|nr:hypothetical protein [Enterovirga sp.]
MALSRLETLAGILGVGVSRMRKIIVGAAVLVAAFSTAAQADIKVGGWDVSDKPDKGVCTASREYRDKDDENRMNGIALVVSKDNAGKDILVVSLAYEGWDWDKDEKTTADFKIDRRVLYRKAVWQAADKTILTGTFTQADELIDALGQGQTMYLTFDKDSEANFRIPNAGMALGAAKLCLGKG